jgi:hypothetical protein
MVRMTDPYGRILGFLDRPIKSGTLQNFSGMSRCLDSLTFVFPLNTAVVSIPHPLTFRYREHVSL